MTLGVNPRREYHMEYYRRNRERLNAYQTAWCKEHSEERKQRRKQRYEKNREKQLRRVKKCLELRKIKIRTPILDRQIRNSKSGWQKLPLLKIKKRVTEERKVKAMELVKERIQKQKDLREEKARAEINARKEKLLNSKLTKDEDKTNSKGLSTQSKQIKGWKSNQGFGEI